MLVNVHVTNDLRRATKHQTTHKHQSLAVPVGVLPGTRGVAFDDRSPPLPVAVLRCMSLTTEDKVADADC